MLLALRDYIQQHGQVNLQHLQRHFDVELPVLQQWLDHLRHQGNVIFITDIKGIKTEKQAQKSALCHGCEQGCLVDQSVNQWLTWCPHKTHNQPLMKHHIAIEQTHAR